MNYYVIKKNQKDYDIEKYSESEWENVKDKLNQNNLKKNWILNMNKFANENEKGIKNQKNETQNLVDH